MNNCRNCGAPLNGSYCEYCGTYYGNKEADDYLRMQLAIAEYNLQCARTDLFSQMQTQAILNTSRRMTDQIVNAYRP